MIDLEPGLERKARLCAVATMARKSGGKYLLSSADSAASLFRKNVASREIVCAFCIRFSKCSNWLSNNSYKVSGSRNIQIPEKEKWEKRFVRLRMLALREKYSRKKSLRRFLALLA